VPPSTGPFRRTATPVTPVTPCERRWWLALAAIAALALALRLLHLAALRDTPLFAVLLGDSREYDRWAREIVGGAWIGTGVFYQAPLYPYLLATVYASFGADPFVVRLLQAVAGAGSCALLGVAGRRFFGAAPGLIAAALLAVYPPAIFFDALIQKSSLDLLLIAALLAAIAAWTARPWRRWLIAAGLALGALILNRENAAILCPVIAGWLWWFPRSATPRSKDRRLHRLGVFTAAVAIVLLPVGLRNYAAGGEFVLTTSQLGTNFYIGNHSQAGGSYESLLEGRGDPAYEREDATRLAEQAAGRRLSPTEVSRYWMSRAWRDMRADPWRWLRLTGRKLLLTVNAHEAVDTESIAVHASYSPVLHAARWLHFGVVLPIAVFGSWITRHAWRRSAVLYLMFAALVVATAAFYVVARYRFPLVPIALLFAGAGIAAIWRALRTSPIWRAEDRPLDAARGALSTGEGRRAVRTGVLLAAATAAIANLPPALASHDDTHLNIAMGLVRLDRPAEAVPLFERAIAESPDHALAHYEMGWALMKIGEPRRAMAAFRTAVALRPDHAEARMTLAGLLLEAGETQAALVQAEAAVGLRPDHFAMRLNLASILLTLDRAPEAVPHLEHALRVVPDSAPDAISALSLLAEAYRRIGRRDDALAALEKALALARAARLPDAARQIETAIAGGRTVR
jgi:tetratricopeptide (TPR) repeat protein